MMNESVTGLVWNGPNMFSSTGRWWRSHVVRPLQLVVKTWEEYLSGLSSGVRHTQQIPGNMCLLLRILFIRQQKCGLENNNKDLVDRVKIVTAEMRGFKLYYLSWFNHKRQPALFPNHLEAATQSLEDLFCLTQNSDLQPPPKKNNVEELKSKEETNRWKERSHLHTLLWWCAHCCWWRTGRCSCSLGDKLPWN